MQQTDKINKSRMNTWDGFSVMDFLRDSLNISEFFSFTINDSTLRPFKYIFCPNQTNERCLDKLRSMPIFVFLSEQSQNIPIENQSL